MTQDHPGGPGRETHPLRPWFREPWPWVAIGIPAIAVIGGLFTLYLAITHPDPLVVDDQTYEEVHSELHAETRAASGPAVQKAEADDTGHHGDGVY